MIGNQGPFQIEANPNAAPSTLVVSDSPQATNTQQEGEDSTTLSTISISIESWKKIMKWKKKKNEKRDKDLGKGKKSVNLVPRQIYNSIVPTNQIFI